MDAERFKNLLIDRLGEGFIVEDIYFNENRELKGFIARIEPEEKFWFGFKLGPETEYTDDFYDMAANRVVFKLKNLE